MSHGIYAFNAPSKEWHQRALNARELTTDTTMLGTMLSNKSWCYLLLSGECFKKATGTILEAGRNISIAGKSGILLSNSSGHTETVKRWEAFPRISTKVLGLKTDQEVDTAIEALKQEQPDLAEHCNTLENAYGIFKSIQTYHADKLPNTTVGTCSYCGEELGPGSYVTLALNMALDGAVAGKSADQLSLDTFLHCDSARSAVNTGIASV